MWSYVQHDWSSLRGDADLALTEAALRAVRERQVATETYVAYAAREIARW